MSCTATVDRKRYTLKKSRTQKSPLKSVTFVKSDMRVELVLYPEMMVLVEAADDWDLWSVPELRQRSPSTAIADVCDLFLQDRPELQHPDVAEVKEFAQFLRKYPVGLPIIQVMAIGWHLLIPNRKAAA